MRHTSEANGSTPIFPQNEVSAAKYKFPVDSSSQAPVPDARTGEMWSPETELQDINYGENLEKFERSESFLASTAPESRGSLRSRTKKHSRKKKPKKVTPEEKMRNLSMECISLSARMRRLRKFSPEWTLSKLEMKLISEELEYLYAESIAKG